jgi:hypothetical protein
MPDFPSVTSSLILSKEELHIITFRKPAYLSKLVYLLSIWVLGICLYTLSDMKNFYEKYLI